MNPGTVDAQRFVKVCIWSTAKVTRYEAARDPRASGR
jgi:hypothetical protein